MNWQPIETAPRDGTEVLLYCAAWSMAWSEMQVAHFEGDGEGGGEWIGAEISMPDNRNGDGPDFDEDAIDNDETDIGPTHWMPLPEAPEATP